MPLNSKAKGAAGEEWRNVPGYEGLYEVSSHGNFRRASKAIQYEAGRPVATYQHKNGYVYVCLCRMGKKATKRAHCLVAEAFIGDRPFGFHVNHLDGDKSNNACSNLEYCSQSENMRHAFKIGLQLPRRGSAASCTKLDELKVMQILAMEFDHPHHAIASMFGITRKSVAAIMSGKSWSHVTGREYANRNRVIGAPRRSNAH